MTPDLPVGDFLQILQHVVADAQHRFWHFNTYVGHDASRILVQQPFYKARTKRLHAAGTMWFGETLNPKPLNPKPLNPKPLNP